MDKLDTVSWKEFKVRDILPPINIKKYAKKPNSVGNIPFISCQTTNNGIASYCGEIPEIQHCITVSTNGNCFDCFYHDYPIIPSSDVEVLSKDGITDNKDISLYLCAVLAPNHKLYSYSHKPKNGKVFDTKIYLPVTDDGTPDWEYMAERIKELEAERIKELEAERIKELEAYLIASGLDDYGLTEEDRDVLNNFGSVRQREFKVSDLFDVDGTKSLDAGNIAFEKDGINFVGRTSDNNGIQGKISLQIFKPNEAFTITATVIGNYKYVKLQEKPYYCSQNINKLMIKNDYKQYFNCHNARYLITHIQKFVEQYNGQQGGYKLGDLRNHIISLPVDSKGNPDWDYMERYIRATEKLVIANAVKWKDQQIAITKQVVDKSIA